MSTTERWEIIPGFERYEASTFGRIRNIATGRILKQYKPKAEKYKVMARWHVCLRMEGNKKPFHVYVHRLIGITFLPNPENLPCINHKDENGLNNHVDNLEWCTYAYNNRYGTVRDRNGHTIALYKDGEQIGVYGSYGILEEQTGLNRRCIQQVATNKAKSYRGYKAYRIPQ